MPFPFTSLTASKKRPAVVVSNRAYSLARPDLIVMAITSQLRPSPGLGDTWIGHWQAAGLLKPSAANRSLPLSNRGSCFAGLVRSAPTTKPR